MPAWPPAVANVSPSDFGIATMNDFARRQPLKISFSAEKPFDIRTQLAQCVIKSM